MDAAVSCGRTHLVLNPLMTVCRSGAAMRDGITILEFRARYGDSPPTHVHYDDDEIFHLVEGRMRFRVGDNEFVLEVGSALVAPKGVPHTFRVESPEGARGFNIMAGSNFENFVRAMGRPAEHAGLPLPSRPTPQQIDRLARTGLAHRVEIVGPPLT